MTDRPDPSVFEEPAHQPAVEGFIESDELRDEPAFHSIDGPGDPRDAPAAEPALFGRGGLPSYGDVYEELRADTTEVEFRSATAIAGALAFASGMLLIPVVAVGSFLWGPPAAVALLVAPTLALVERRPWQVSSRWVAFATPVLTTVPVWVLAVLLAQTQWVGRVAAVVFAVSLSLAAGVLGVGLADLWRRAHHDHRPPRLRPIVPHMVAAGVTVLLGMIVALAVAI